MSGDKLRGWAERYVEWVDDITDRYRWQLLVFSLAPLARLVYEAIR